MAILLGNIGSEIHIGTEGYTGVEKSAQSKDAIKAIGTNANNNKGGDSGAFDSVSIGIKKPLYASEEVSKLQETQRQNVKAALKIFESAVSVEPDEYGDLRIILEHKESGQILRFPPDALAVFYRGEIGTEEGRSIIIEKEESDGFVGLAMTAPQFRALFESKPSRLTLKKDGQPIASITAQQLMANRKIPHQPPTPAAA